MAGKDERKKGHIGQLKGHESQTSSSHEANPLIYGRATSCSHRFF